MSHFYWCLSHEKVEEGARCRALERLGPYESPEAARAWRDRLEQRDESWQAEDERWSDDNDGADGAAQPGR